MTLIRADFLRLAAAFHFSDYFEKPVFRVGKGFGGKDRVIYVESRDISDRFGDGADEFVNGVVRGEMRGWRWLARAALD